MSRSAFVARLGDWLLTLFVGFWTVTYWRGTWVLFDIWFCGQSNSASLTSGDSFCFSADAGVDPATAVMRRNTAFLSYGIGIWLLAIGIGMMWSGSWSPGNVIGTGVQIKTALFRFIAVYILGGAAVSTWRGVWYFLDYYLLPTILDKNGLPLASYWLSSVVGSTVSFLFCAGGSLLATPAIFLYDGISPPPLAVTIVSSYFSLTLEAGDKPKKQNIPVLVLDLLISFIILPIFVVMYWRGSWMILDFYLWGLTTESKDLHLSIIWGAAISIILMVLTSESVVSMAPQIKSKFAAGCFNRLRTYILAWGTVNFWRVVWYIWDEFIGGPSCWSAWAAHIFAVAILSMLGCLSCIAAPPATLGIDVAPNPMAVKEPMFDLLPVKSEKLNLFGIGKTMPDQAEDCMTEVEV